jgi:three-Cys-motif partner protein
VNEIVNAIPRHGPGFNVLTFCFVDPYRLANLHFETIRRLSERFVDFLILIPTGMDAKRNWRNYLDPTNRIVDNFVGTAEWREAWKEAEKSGESVEVFLPEFFTRQMKTLGYLELDSEEQALIRSYEKNLPLYRLCFYSRNKLGKQFWRQTKKYSDPQTSLF